MNVRWGRGDHLRNRRGCRVSLALWAVASTVSLGSVVPALAQTYLRRAEAMEREGRVDIARNLVEEVLGYDLRKAVPEVRFALQERLELQIARERGWKP